jgi:hypothetical protein
MNGVNVPNEFTFLKGMKAPTKLSIRSSGIVMIVVKLKVEGISI